VSAAVESEEMALVVRAVAAEAARIAEKPVTLVSVTFDHMAPLLAGEAATTHVNITRATRTLVFATAKLRSADGRLLMTASSVHRI
jgi:acyl-CoA thioesterase FadM